MNAIHFYRIANRLYRWRVPLLPGIVRYLVFILYNSVIPPECTIGSQCIFGHGGIGVVLHPHCKIGDRVLIGQGVTLGGSFGAGPPVVESDVWLGPGCRLLGEIVVGTNSIIGANAVVTRDVPPNTVVGGVPAKVLRMLEPGQLDVPGGRLRER